MRLTVAKEVQAEVNPSKILELIRIKFFPFKTN